MLRQHFLAITCVVYLFANFSLAADDAPQVLVAQGVIEKFDKESITIKHRSADGKFGKNLVFKLTGTSRFSTLSTQKRSEKTVFVQKDADAKSLVEKQQISVIYAENGEEHVLLAAVLSAN